MMDRSMARRFVTQGASQLIIKELEDLTARLEAANDEIQEQCRIIGMGAERELSILAKLEAAEKENARLTECVQNHDNASKLIDAWCAEHGGQIPWNKAVEITAILTKMPEAERMRLLHLDPDTSMQEALAEQAAQIEALKADAERLDALESLGTPGMKWVCRVSVTGRGYRLHQDPKHGEFRTVREAIDAARKGVKP